MPGFFREDKGRLLVHLRVTPRAAGDGLDGVETRDDGEEVLRLRVRAVPDAGKANLAVVGLLARSFGVPKSAVSIMSGETARIKTIAIVGDVPALVAAAARLASA